jgi:hypothetical protein
MHHPAPMEDCIIIHCKGRCGKFQTLVFSQLRATLMRHELSLYQYMNTYVCIECEAHFVAMIEEIVYPDSALEKF